jgi:methyl-accepting chemotaxis protein
MAASIVDVYDELKWLSARMWRGYGEYTTSAPQPTLPGMVPEIHRLVSGLAARIAGIEKQVADTGSLLNAVNQQTLGRIESAVNGVVPYIGSQVIDVKADISTVQQSLAGVNQDVVALRAQVDDLAADVEKELMAIIELHAKVDGVKKDIAGLEKP